MQESDKDKWIHLLMDAELTSEQRSELEKRMESLPKTGKSSDFEKEQLLRSYLQEIGKEAPVGNHPDFMWSQVKDRITAEVPARQEGVWDIF